MRAISPGCSVHALDLEKLPGPDITFWSAWEGEQLLGCGAEPAVLATIVGEARARNFRRPSLETGATAPFFPAQALYRSAGFEICGPFQGYAPDPNSVFMSLRL